MDPLMHALPILYRACCSTVSALSAAASFGDENLAQKPLRGG
jgi:hypothetical protein